MRFTLILKNCVKSRGKEWRDASTLILARQKFISSEKDAVEFMMMQRSTGSAFMAGGMCFPGGTVSAADGSKDWIDLYRKTGIDLTKLQFLKPNARRPEVYDSEPEANTSLPKQISLRITAIRETFEESGVLICIPAAYKPTAAIPKYEFLSNTDIQTWQIRIKAKPTDFLNLCSELNVVPHLEALFEWGNWLTPVSYKPAKRRRFDTMFYIAFVHESPPTVIDTHEVADLLWSSPSDLLDDHSRGRRLLFPPQIYEMSRLCHIQRLEKMKALAKSRLDIGVERWCPFLMRATDGLLGVLPGDDLYPQNPDIYTHREIEQLRMSMQEAVQTAQKHHRWQLPQAGGRPTLSITIPDRFGQIYG